MKKKRFIVDGHLDLSMNAMEWNRDLRMDVHQIRLLEQKQSDKPDRAKNTVSLPELRKGNIGLVISTLIARYAKPTHPLGGCNSPEQAWATVCGQLAWYEEMMTQGELKMIRTKHDLEVQIENWSQQENYDSIGFILSLEGADSIVTFDHLYRLHEKGLRAIGPAHYGPGTYAYGTDSDGPLGTKGRELLHKMDELNMVLDLTHLSDTSFWEAMELFKGRIWASHNNCRALVDHNRQFADDQIRMIIQREGIIGLPLDAWMMVPNWKRGFSNPQNTDVRLDHMIDHLVHICEIAGSVNYVGFGTDLDGGFGKEQCPSDLEDISELHKLDVMLKSRGFTDYEIDQIFHKNWVNILLDVLPVS